MSEFFDFIKTLIEKYGLKSLMSFVLSIFTVIAIPKAWIEKLPFGDGNIYWAIGVSFAIWLIILHCITLIFEKIRNKIGYNIYNIDGGQIEMNALKISSVNWLILFILLAIFIMMRHVDGAGVVQTMPIKLINLAVLAVFALIVLVGHLIWLLIVRKRQNI